jgi:hypothetical protein
LFDLITIYDEEEISEVSLVTPVQITEEKEPERASTPGLNASNQNLSQRDHEVESVLDTELLDLPRNPIYRSRDELGSGGQKEGIPQLEIDTSTADYQVSTEPTPGSSFLVDTSPFDEKQTEVKPLGHMEEAQEHILEQIHTARSLGNTLTWGEQQILEPVDEVADI